MLKPTNSAAEQIVSLRSVNGDIDTQIASLQAAQARNLETITAFEEIATWVEVADETPVVVEEPVVVPAEPLSDVVVPELDPNAEPAPVVEVVSDAEVAPVTAEESPVEPPVEAEQA
jgi:hypothetical protein